MSWRSLRLVKNLNVEAHSRNEKDAGRSSGTMKGTHGTQRQPSVYNSEVRKSKDAEDQCFASPLSIFPPN